MKRISKKFGFFAVITAGLAALAFIACMNPVDPTETLGVPYEPPEGYGFVRLNISNNVARTIIPTETLALTSFLSYRLIITAGPTTIAPINGDLTTVQAPVDLIPGTYNIEVIAFRDDGPLNDHANQVEDVARAVVTGHVVSPGSNSALTLTVSPFDPSANTSGKTGNFSWDITLDNWTPVLSDTKADMYITGMPGMTNATATHALSGGTAIDLETAASDDDADLVEGYYFVDFDMEYNDVPIHFRQVLHVYRNMESPFTITFDGDDFTPFSSQQGFSIGVGNIAANIPPALALTATPLEPLTTQSLADALAIDLNSSGNSTLSIDVTNLAAYGTGNGLTHTVQWFLHNHTAITGATLALDTAGNASALEDGKTYTLTVVVRQDLGNSEYRLHSTFIFIRVIDTQ